MYNNKPVIDVHGHISTPPHFRAYAFSLQIIRTPGSELTIPPAAMRAALDQHLQAMDERGIDVQLLSPRPVAMMHWERPFLVDDWTRTTNDVIAEQCRAEPRRLVGIAQLPQNLQRGCEACTAELQRCVEELGFVGAILNPDPGSNRQAPLLSNPYWYPIYEKAQSLNATLVVHPSITLDPRLDGIPHAYQYNNLTEETLATLSLETSDVFDRYPDLRMVICHCGGALRRMLYEGQPFDALRERRGEISPVGPSGRQGGGQVGMRTGKKKVVRDLSRNLFFDTCAYDPHFLTAAIRQRGVDRMVFGTEAPGAGTDVLNNDSGRPSDDVLAMIAGFDFLALEDKLAIVHGNPRRVFPLLETHLPLS
jgi:predicted TIM-barrel fold metal-dependent hydrolase